MSDQLTLTYFDDTDKFELVLNGPGAGGEDLSGLVRAQETAGLAGEALVATILAQYPGAISQIERYRGGVRFGDLNDGPDHQPAVQRFDSAGREIYAARYRDGLRHDGPNGEPAIISCGKGKAQRVERYLCGLRHDGADGAPAIEVCNEDGDVYYLEHYREGFLHDCFNGEPAVALMNEEGTRLRSVVRYQWGELGTITQGVPVRQLYSDKTGKLTHVWEAVHWGNKTKIVKFSAADIKANNEPLGRKPNGKKKQVVEFEY